MRFCKFYGCKFSFFKGCAQTQTGPRDPKSAISHPASSFRNANRRRFSMLNFALVKYQFQFSDTSTRFPCDIFHPTLKQPEKSKFETLLSSLNISILWQDTFIYSAFHSFYIPKMPCFQPPEKTSKWGHFTDFGTFFDKS